jgi:hypothetical protein
MYVNEYIFTNGCKVAEVAQVAQGGTGFAQGEGAAHKYYSATIFLIVTSTIHGGKASKQDW